MLVVGVLVCGLGCVCLFSAWLGKVGAWFVCQSVVWEGILCDVDAEGARGSWVVQFLLETLLGAGLLIRHSRLFGLVGRRAFGRHSEDFLQRCFALPCSCVLA